MKLHLIEPRGFCFGVTNAIGIIDKTILEYPQKKIYVYHEIVHNRNVLDDFRRKNVTFTEDLSSIPENAIVILPAHGTPKDIEAYAKAKFEVVIDAVCPIVKQTHHEVLKYQSNNQKIVIIGKKKHLETVAINSQINNEGFIVSSTEDVKNIPFSPADSISFVTQTTLSNDDVEEIVKELKTKFPSIKSNSRDGNICRATQDRQAALKNILPQLDLLIVAGSNNSSNSTKLKEIGEKFGVDSYLLDDENEITKEILGNKTNIGITAGASAPEYLVQKIIEKIDSLS